MSSLTAVVASVIGSHFGFVSICFRSNKDRLVHWCVLGMLMIIIGVIVDQCGLKMNTDLYSFSYLLVSTGVAAMLFCACYLVSDVRTQTETNSKTSLVPMILQPFQWLGLNSILIFLFSCAGLTQSVLSCFYWGESDRNLAELLYPTGKIVEYTI